MNFPNIFYSKKEILIPIILFCALLLFNPSIFFQPSNPVYMQMIPAGSFALLALVLILFNPAHSLTILSRMNPLAILAIFLLASISFGHFVLSSSYQFIHLGESWMWISIPLCVCIFYHSFQRSLRYFLAIIGLYSTLHCLFVPRTNGWVWGITGNINFTAALLIATTPFLILYLYRALQRCHFIPSWEITIISVIFSLAVIIIFIKCSSRGAFLAILVTGGLFLYCKISDRGRRIMIYCMILLGIIGSLLFLRFGVDPLAKKLVNEDRLFFYTGTLQMIRDNPLFGVGGVSFENEFVKYKPLDYFFTRHVADRTDHPHSEALFMMSSFGLAGYLAWGFLVLVPCIHFFRRMLRRENIEFELKLYFFIFLFLLFHAQCDLIFFAWPTNLIALMILGLFWRISFTSEKVFLILPKYSVLGRISLIAGIFILLVTGIGIAQSSYSSWMTWRLLNARQPRTKLLQGIDHIISFSPYEYTQNYALMILSEKLDAPEMTLKITNAMIKGHIENYGHVYLHRGNALARLGRYEEACEAYRKDSKNYPLTVLPYLRMITLCRLIGKDAWIPNLEKRLNELLALRGITPRMLTAIQKDPFYDMRPWCIPSEDGGPGGIVTFADGRKEQWY